MYYESSFPNNNNQMIIQNNQFPFDTNQSQSQIQTPDKIKKKVNFNNNVDVINVESYKEFNKIEDDYFNQYYNNLYASLINNKTKPKNKKDCNCSCIIL